jgi:histidyl-tRNA synthetase
MIDEKGLEPVIADKIWEYVQLKGGREIVTQLQEKPEVIANESAKAGLEDMALLCDYLSIFDVLPSLSIDMSLARGLDYYTGVIYEVVTEGSAPKITAADTAKKEKKPKKSNDPDADRSDDPTLGVGSVAAGGRYDKLVGMFSGKPIPCVGISFGVDRIFSITKNLNINTTVRETEVEVLVMAFGSGEEFTGLLPARMATVKQLWEAGIKAEYTWKAKPKWQKEFDYAKKKNDLIPWTVILGDEEEIQGMVKVKDMGLPKDHPEAAGVLIEKAKLVEELKVRLGRGKNTMLPKDYLEKDYLEKDHPEKDHLEKDLLEKDHLEKDHLEEDHPEKDHTKKDHPKKDGVLTENAKLVEELKARLARGKKTEVPDRTTE